MVVDRMHCLCRTALAHQLICNLAPIAERDSSRVRHVGRALEGSMREKKCSKRWPSGKTLASRSH